MSASSGMPAKFVTSNAPLTALDVMQDAPVIPVITLDDPGIAVDLAHALVAGGIRMLEVTLRTAAALACVRRIAQGCPDAVVGVGTVCSARDVAAAVDAGARFAVSPGYTPALGVACRAHALPLLPGAVTPSEIMAALEDGFGELKFFPAFQSGAAAMLKALAGPFPHVRFCPTGGITAANATEFLLLPNVACVGGSWLVPADAVGSRDFDRIESLARAAAALPRN